MHRATVNRSDESKAGFAVDQCPEQSLGHATMPKPSKLPPSRRPQPQSQLQELVAHHYAVGAGLIFCAIALTQVGGFIAGIPAPLGIGTVELEDGESVKGFLCETYGLAGATDITAFGGWRAWQARQRDRAHEQAVA